MVGCLVAVGVCAYVHYRLRSVLVLVLELVLLMLLVFFVVVVVLLLPFALMFVCLRSVGVVLSTHSGLCAVTRRHLRAALRFAFVCLFFRSLIFAGGFCCIDICLLYLEGRCRRWFDRAEQRVGGNTWSSTHRLRQWRRPLWSIALASSTAVQRPPSLPSP